MAEQRFDLAIVGGGIVGLATAMALRERGHRALVVLEAEPRLAAHQSGRNSGVIHSGLYYRPGSLKARLCTEGREALYAFCRDHGVPHRRCGKLVVAVDEGEVAALDELARRGRQNGLEGLRRLESRELGRYEPAAAGAAGLWVPQTGVVDFAAVSRAFAGRLEERGVSVRTGARVGRIRRRDGVLELATPRGIVRARALINCGGLESDRLAHRAGASPDTRIVPIRGDYYELTGASAARVRGLLYPVPDPTLPFLGVHLTRTIDGRVLAGPNAVLTLSRRGYRRWSLSPRDAAATLGYPGFWRLARRFWRTALRESARSLSRRRFARELRRLAPELSPADLRPASSGVRAQAVDREGRLVDDFRIARSPRALHVLNAPSPAATAALAIGAYLAGEAEECLGE